MCKRNGYLFIAVTRDEYELPLAVAESGDELGRMLGLSPGAVTHWMKKCGDHGWWCPYRSIYIGKETDNDTEAEAVQKR